MWSSITTYASARSMANMRSTNSSIIGRQSPDGPKDTKNSVIQKCSRPYGVSQVPPLAVVLDPCSPRQEIQDDGEKMPPRPRGSPKSPNKSEKVPTRPQNELRRTASQNFLRAKLIDIGRQNGIHDGLNVAIGCKDQELSQDPKNFDIIKRGSSPFSSPMTLKSESTSSTSLFDVEETLSFELTSEDKETSSPANMHQAVDAWKAEIECSGSVISVYSNPKYGKGQRELVIPTSILQFTEQGESFLITSGHCDPEVLSQDSTDVILSPFISDSALSVGQEESETFFEAVDDIDEIPDPSIAARDYNNHLLLVRRPGVNHVDPTMDVGPLTCSVPVTHIPCDSWIALPLRILPGNVVPHGLIIFLPPLLLTLFSALALIFL